MLQQTVRSLANKNYKNWRGLRSKKELQSGMSKLNTHVIKRTQEHRRGEFSDLFHRNLPSVPERYLKEKANAKDMTPRGTALYHMIEGKGDNEPLSMDPNYGYNVNELLLHGKDAWKHAPEPIPLTPLAMKKMREGNWWPSAPTNLERATFPKYLTHPESMSPSARKFAFAVEYWIRRDLKAIPFPAQNNLDFTQLVIERVICSRRSTKMYVVWSTVHPGARKEIEPHITRIAYWIRRKIRQRIRNRPNIPEIRFIYNDRTSLLTSPPRHMLQDIKKATSDWNVDMEGRLKEIREMDTISQRLKHVPWYMPYIWAKDQRVALEKQKKSDYAEFHNGRERPPTSSTSRTQQFAEQLPVMASAPGYLK